MPYSTQDISNLPPEQRSYILVSSDNKFTELCRNKKLVKTLRSIGWGVESQQNEGEISSKNEVVSRGFNKPLQPFIPNSSQPDSQINKLVSNAKDISNATISNLSHLTQETKAFLERRKEKKEIEISNRISIPRMTPQEAQLNFTFGAGELKDGGIYIINPFNLKQYIPISSYYDYLAKEKVAAFLRVSQTLGAKELRLQQASFTSSNILTRASLGAVASHVGINAVFTKSNQIKENIIATYSKPKQAPYIPDELREPVEADAQLRTIAFGRMGTDGNMESFAYSLTIYEADASFGKLTSNIRKSSLYTGSESKAIRGTKWDFSIIFWPGFG